MVGTGYIKERIRNGSFVAHKQGKDKLEARKGIIPCCFKYSPKKVTRKSLNELDFFVLAIELKLKYRHSSLTVVL